MTLSANPSQPVYHSQSFLLMSIPWGTRRDAYGPGTARIETRKMMIAGPAIEARVRCVVETSSSLYGYDMLRSTSEKG